MDSLTPEEFVTENELICVKLLGWKLAGRGMFGAKMWLDHPNGDDGERWHTVPTPSFDTWAEAGLILEQFERMGCDWDIERTETDDGFKTTVRVFAHRSNVCIRNAADVAGAIRATALDYIKAVKS